MARPRIDRPRMSTVLTSTGVLTSRGAALLQLAFVNSPSGPGFSGRGTLQGVEPLGAQRATARALHAAGFLREILSIVGAAGYAITPEGEVALSAYYDGRGDARPAGLRTSIRSKYKKTAARATSSDSPESDPVETVNHPPHYGGDTTYEVIKVLRAWGLDESFELGSAVKYLARLGKKNGASPIEDLKKARWYIDSKIAELEGKS